MQAPALEPRLPIALHPHHLERLLHKYRTLSRLRRDRALGLPLPPRAVFQALAGEFPGALFELDRLQLDEIDKRSEQIETALASGSAARWMTIMHAYHGLLRAALFIKPQTSRLPALSREQALAMAERAKGRADGLEHWIGEDFVHAVAHPPEGRINTIVFEYLSAMFGEPSESIQGILLDVGRKTRETGAAP